MNDKTESLSVTSIYDNFFEDIYKDLLQKYNRSAKRKFQRNSVPNPNKSELVLQLISKIYEISLHQLRKTPEKYVTSDWLKEARGMLYYIHFYHLEWKKKDVFKHFYTTERKHVVCFDFFVERKDIKSTKDKYNYIVEKLSTIEI